MRISHDCHVLVGQTHLTDPVCHFVSSRHLVDSSRARRKEDEFASWLQEGSSGLEEGKVAENLKVDVEAHHLERNCPSIATHVDSPVFLEDSQIDFAKRLEPFAHQDCGVAYDLRQNSSVDP